jgi:antitoxin (DNA-binding transcriptional repressor) of toxin-antitoxin stability system
MASSWLDGASAGPVGVVTESGGTVSAVAAAGPTMQASSKAAATLRMRRFSDIKGSAREINAYAGHVQRYPLWA